MLGELCVPWSLDLTLKSSVKPRRRFMRQRRIHKVDYDIRMFRLKSKGKCPIHGDESQELASLNKMAIMMMMMMMITRMRRRMGDSGRRNDTRCV